MCALLPPRPPPPQEPVLPPTTSGRGEETQKINSAKKETAVTRGAFMCGRCGLPKKGHVCTNPTTIASGKEKRKNNSAKKENAVTRGTFMCGRCGLPKKGHVCAMKVASQNKNNANIRTDQVCTQCGSSTKDGHICSSSCPQETPDATLLGADVRAKPSTQKTKRGLPHDPVLAEYAIRESSHSLFDCTMCEEAPPFRCHHSSKHGGHKGPRSQTLAAWWAARAPHELMGTALPPALRVADQQEQRQEAVVVPPYHSAAPSPLSASSSPSCYLNAAGPVWGSAFAPHCPAAQPIAAAAATAVQATAALTRHLVVATSRVGWLTPSQGRATGVFRHGVGNDSLRELQQHSQCTQVDDNLLQLWKVEVGEAASMHYMVHVEQEQEQEQHDDDAVAAAGRGVGDQGGCGIGPHWQVGAMGGCSTLACASQSISCIVNIFLGILLLICVNCAELLCIHCRWHGAPRQQC